MSGNATLIAQLGSAMTNVPKGPLGVAVSGGSDSVALLRLLKDWADKVDCKIFAATVNHNLRPEAHAEVKFVADLCGDLGVRHAVLNWNDWDGKGNLQNAARNARKDLLSVWAHDLGLTAVALGHTQDDQAETFLMRLARGSGVDGLSGMQQISGRDPVWVRPLLEVPRAVLRDYLAGLDQDWIDDPSNIDEKFDRVKMRNAIPVLAELGLTAQRLASTAKGLQSARAALEFATQDVAQKCCEPSGLGTVTIDLKKLQTAPFEIQYRVLSHAMGWVTGDYYRPRFLALKSIYELLTQGKSQTLAGCYIKTRPSNQVIVMREVAAMAPVALETGSFDGRWQISADQDMKDAEVRPLGDAGLTQLKNWRDLNVLRDVLLQTPAVWRDGAVISAPLAGFKGPVDIFLKSAPKQFFLGIVSH